MEDHEGVLVGVAAEEEGAGVPVERVRDEPHRARHCRNHHLRNWENSNNLERSKWYSYIVIDQNLLVNWIFFEESDQILSWFKTKCAVVGCGKTILWSQTSCINISMPSEKSCSKNVFHHIFITWQSWPAYFFVDYLCRHICNGFMAQYEKSQRSNLWPFPINPSFWIHLTCGKLFYCFSCYCFTVLPVRIGPLSLLLGWSEDQQQTGPSPAFPSFEEILLELAEVSEYFWSTSSAKRGRQLTLDVRNQIGVTNFVIDLFFQKFRVMINI